MVQTAAKVFGVVFIVIGLLGFVPALTPNGNLLGIFEVGLVHNLVHILSGVAALVLSSSYSGAKTYFKVFGVVYALVTVLGIFYGDRALLGIMNHNIADIFLHMVIAAAALYLGFGTPKDQTTAR